MEPNMLPTCDQIISRRRDALTRLQAVLVRLAASQQYLTGESIKGEIPSEFPSGESFVATCAALDDSMRTLLFWLEDLVMQSEAFTGTFNAQRQ